MFLMRRLSWCYIKTLHCFAFKSNRYVSNISSSHKSTIVIPFPVFFICHITYNQELCVVYVTLFQYFPISGVLLFLFILFTSGRRLSVTCPNWNKKMLQWSNYRIHDNFIKNEQYIQHPI
jgi:hypothetical protein